MRQVISRWAHLRHGAILDVDVIQHTFGRHLNFNCHLHVLVSGFGLRTSESRFVPVRLDAVEIMGWWRDAVTLYLQEVAKLGQLQSALSTEALAAGLISQGRRKWSIHIARFQSKEKLLHYAGRYVRRPPIAQHRFLNITGEHVEFWTNDRKLKRRVKTRYQIDDFVATLADHTLEREFKRAIELNPNSALSHARYAVCLITRLRLNESVAEAQRAQELDPLSPDIVSALGIIYFVGRQYDRSIAQLQKALDLNPNIPVVRATLGSAYAMKRMYPQALAEYDKIPTQDKVTAEGNQFVAGTLGWVYAISGRRSDALKIAQQFRELSAHAYVDFYWSAVIPAGLGDKDETFRLLEKGYLEHSAALPYFAVDPFWYGMHSDPRFADLLRRIGLPQTSPP